MSEEQPIVQPIESTPSEPVVEAVEKVEQPDRSTTVPELPAFTFVEDASFALVEDANLKVQVEQSAASGESILKLVELDDDLEAEARAELAENTQAMEATQAETQADAAKELGAEGTDINTGLRADGVYDIEHPNTPKEIKEQAFEHGIKLMREALNDIDGYSVFASTAMYLQGRRAGIDEFQVLPGDFDAVAHSLQDLRRIQERMNNVPGFQETKSELVLAGDAEAFNGEIIMQVETKDGPVKANYPLEFFFGSFIVDKDVFKHTEKAAGLNVLSMEGLQSQYANNLEFEKRVGKGVQDVARFLLQDGGTNPDGEQIPEVASLMKEQLSQENITSPLAVEIMKRFGLTKEKLAHFYKIVDEVGGDEEGSVAVLEEQIGEISKTLSGFKTKIPKRAKNLREIREASKLEIPEKSSTKAAQNIDDADDGMPIAA